MTSRRRIASLTLVLGIQVAQVVAHGGGSHSSFGGGADPHADGGSFGSTPAPARKHRNETVAEIEKERYPIRSELDELRRTNGDPTRTQQLEHAMRLFAIRQEIAEGRTRRDQLRDEGQSEQADELDRKIHEFKGELARLEKAGSSE